MGRLIILCLAQNMIIRWVWRKPICSGFATKFRTEQGGLGFRLHVTMIPRLSARSSGGYIVDGSISSRLRAWQGTAFGFRIENLSNTIALE